MAELDNIDVELRHLKMVKSILARHLPYKQVWAYGSRVKWTASEISDVDCTVFEATDSEIANAQEAFDESDIPFEIQLLNWETIPDDFKENIKEQYFILQSKGDWRETELGNIPKKWKYCSVNKLVNENILAKPLDGNHGSIHPKGADFIDNGIPFIMASDINNGHVDLRNCKFISKEQANNLQKGFSVAHDVLLTHKASLGRTAIVPQINTEFIMLTPQVTYYRIKDKTQLNNKYLKYYFDSPRFQDVLVNHGDAGSTRAYVGITAQRELPICLPPLPEQKAIASVLSSLDDKIDLLHEQSKTLESLAQTLFRQWFIEETHDDWEEGKLGDLASISSGKGIKIIEYNENGIYPVLGANGEIGRTDQYLYDTNVIYTGRVGTLGNIFIHYGKAWFSDNTLIIKPDDQKMFYFIYFYLIKAKLSIYNIGSTQPLIKQSDIKVLPIFIPNKELMQKFNVQAEDLFSKIKHNQNQIKTLESIRDTLLPKLMSGSVRMKYEETI